MTDLEVHILPEELTLPLFAAWRTLEKCLNPVFSFPLKCSSCQKLSAGDGSQGPSFIVSKKKLNGQAVIIGIQCVTEGCKMVVKFERSISPGNEDFPSRLRHYPKSGLYKEGSPEEEVSMKGLETIKSLLELK